MNLQVPRNLLLPCLLIAMAVGSPARADKLPDAVGFRVTMELGAVERAREWLAAGMDPDFKGDRFGNGLMIGAWEGNIALMEVFLAHGVDINGVNANGEQAIALAAWRGHKAAVEWLLAHGAEVDAPAGQWGALHYASFAGHADVVELLLARGADIDARAPNGSTPLMVALYDGHPDIAKRLLNAGARRDLKNDRGDGALEWAMRFGHTAIARELVSREEFARVAAQSKESWGKDTRSLTREKNPLEAELDRLLQARALLDERGLKLARIDDQIATARAALARAALPSDSGLRVEIRARKDDPQDQSLRVLPTR
jgi:hypothetical protein